MEQNVVHKPPNFMVKPMSGCKIKIPDLDLNDTKKDDHSHYLVSPLSQSATSRMSSNGKWSCLCSPTTHAGSFRCRQHRASGIIRGRSVGSNLSELASKSGEISDNEQ